VRSCAPVRTCSTSRPTPAALYLLDAGRPRRRRRPARTRGCGQVIATGHLPGTLARAAAVHRTPTGWRPAERWMVLSQADGNPRDAAPRVRRQAVREVKPAERRRAATVPGGTSPTCQDARQPCGVRSPCHYGSPLLLQPAFRLFGVKQSGNPTRRCVSPTPRRRPRPRWTSRYRGLVIRSKRRRTGSIAAGQLQKARLAVVPARGQEDRVRLGRRCRWASRSTRRKSTRGATPRCAVVRSLNSSGCRAVAFDLHTGVDPLAAATRPRAREDVVHRTGRRADRAGRPVRAGGRGGRDRRGARRQRGEARRDDPRARRRGCSRPSP